MKIIFLCEMHLQRIVLHSTPLLTLVASLGEDRTGRHHRRHIFYAL
jgi:hypothetical protein